MQFYWNMAMVARLLWEQITHLTLQKSKTPKSLVNVDISAVSVFHLSPLSAV